MKLRLYNLKNKIYPITNKKYKNLLTTSKNSNNIEDIHKINDTNHYIRGLYISKHLKIELQVPTISFVNIQKPEKDEWAIDFNNKTRLQEVKILSKHNPKNYKAYIFKNKSHYVFNKKQPANKIISIIKKIL